MFRRTTNEVSQDEVQAVESWAASNPEYDSAENGEKLTSYVLNTLQAVIDADSLNFAFQKLKDQLVPFSKALVNLRQVAKNYDPTRFQQFSDWFNKQHRFVIDGDEGYRTAASLLVELSGREINETNIYTAVARAQAHARPLHWKETPVLKTQEPRRGQHTADDSHKTGSLFGKETQTDTGYYPDGRKNHGSPVWKKQEETQSQKQDDSLKSYTIMISNLCNNSSIPHSHQKSLQQYRDKCMAAGLNARETYHALERESRQLTGEAPNFSVTGTIASAGRR